VPATGWYEWQKINAKTKRPYHFKPKAEPFSFAGVYDVWKGDGGRAITSFAIVTTDAAPSTAQYHDRMPVVLEGLAVRRMDARDARPSRGADEALRLCDRGVGSRARSRQREEQQVGADGAHWAFVAPHEILIF
jgi:putative SOS response-associated peptidase YedK